MSAFLFKQTETAGANCACEARTLGRGNRLGLAPAHRLLCGARQGGAEGGAEAGLLSFLRRLMVEAGSGDQSTGSCGRQSAKPFLWQAFQEPHRVPELLWKTGRGRSSSCLWSRLGICRSSASSGLQSSREF